MTVTVKLPPLPVRQCPVSWSSIAFDDGHVSRGSFAFAEVPP